jgi:hypothetical protein
MARHESSRWKLSYGWLRGEDWWGDPVSNNFSLIDLLLHPFVETMNETAPPIIPTIGLSYIIGANATGDWTGKDNNLAVYTEFGWLFCEPLVRGIRVGSAAPAGWFFWDGEQWTDEKNVVPDPPPLQGQRYDVIFSVGYDAEPLETIGGVALPQDMVLRADGVDCVGRCKTAPAFPVDIGIMRNYDDQIGTIHFIPGSIEATFTVDGDKAFARGQTISFDMPVLLPDFWRNYGATLRLILMGD